MSSGIYIATSGALAQDAALDTTANNLANASTTGFQGQRVAFREVLATKVSPDAKFAAVGEIANDPRQGSVRDTGNPLDLAIVGEGYLAVDTPNGTRYTRDGALVIDQSGTLVTSEGYAVQGEGGPLTVPTDAKDVRLDDDGKLWADGAEIGQVGLFSLPDDKRREGDRLWSGAGTPVSADDSAGFVSGALEDSNVNMIRGVVDLVKISRNYESLMRVIQTYRDVETSSATKLGKGR